jgi:hypothetical protein
MRGMRAHVHERERSVRAERVCMTLVVINHKQRPIGRVHDAHCQDWFGERKRLTDTPHTDVDDARVSWLHA